MAIRPKTHMLVFSRILITLGALASPTFSDAASFTFNSGSTTGTGFGNSVQRSDSGISVTATGWSLDNLSGAFQSGRIKIWSSGMGVCNQGEGLNCSNPAHPVDNSGRYDFLLFSFSQSVLLDEAELTAWASDFDATLWAGTGSLSLNGQTISSAGLGSGIEDLFTSNNAVAGSTTRTLDLSSTFSNPVSWFLIGASLQNTSPYDSFKFETLTVNVPSPGSEVPEPATILLFGTGLVGVWVARQVMKSRQG